MNTGLRNVRMAAAVGIALAAGLALTACGGNSGDSSAKDSAAPTSAAATTAATTPTAGATDSATPAAPVAKTAGGTGGAADNGGGKAVSRCTTSNLDFSFGPDSGAQSVDSPGAITVVLANQGGSSCTLSGFPGVDIVSKSGTHWSLVRQSKKYDKVTLTSGADASFVITYQPSDGSDGFQAASLLVTPPGETHSTTLKWDGFADVMDQSGATHSGTYVGPVAAGGGS